MIPANNCAKTGDLPGGCRSGRTALRRIERRITRPRERPVPARPADLVTSLEETQAKAQVPEEKRKRPRHRPPISGASRVPTLWAAAIEVGARPVGGISYNVSRPTLPPAPTDRQPASYTLAQQAASRGMDASLPNPRHQGPPALSALPQDRPRRHRWHSGLALANSQGDSGWSGGS